MIYTIALGRSASITKQYKISQTDSRFIQKCKKSFLESFLESFPPWPTFKEIPIKNMQ